MTSLPCNKCQATKDKFAQARKSERRKVAHTFEFVSCLESEPLSKESTFLYSFVLFRAVLASFCFMTIPPRIDIYNIFYFQHTHSRSLGVSKIVERMSNMSSKRRVKIQPGHDYCYRKRESIQADPGNNFKYHEWFSRAFWKFIRRAWIEGRSL